MTKTGVEDDCLAVKCKESSHRATIFISFVRNFFFKCLKEHEYRLQTQSPNISPCNSLRHSLYSNLYYKGFIQICIFKFLWRFRHSIKYGGPAGNGLAFDRNQILALNNCSKELLHTVKMQTFLRGLGKIDCAGSSGENKIKTANVIL